MQELRRPTYPDEPTIHTEQSVRDSVHPSDQKTKLCIYWGYASVQSCPTALRPCAYLYLYIIQMLRRTSRANLATFHSS
jgi:hypothetical protein